MDTETSMLDFVHAARNILDKKHANSTYTVYYIYTTLCIYSCPYDITIQKAFIIPG